MGVILTVVATSRDWRMLRAWVEEVLAIRARQAGALDCRTYRNVHDASQLLIVAELPDVEALWTLHRAFDQGEYPPPARGPLAEQTWEPTGWDNGDTLRGGIPMSIEQNKATIRRIFEVGINRSDPGIFQEVISPTYVNHSMPAPVPGPEGFAQVVGLFQQAFPDFQVTVERVIAEGDLVASRGRFTGTHRGDLMGIPATGRAIDAGYQDLWRIADGKCEENWVILDMMTLMQQLGVVPAPGQ